MCLTTYQYNDSSYYSYPIYIYIYLDIDMLVKTIFVTRNYQR